MDIIFENRYAAFVVIDWVDNKYELCLREAGSVDREYEVIETGAIHSWVKSLRERFTGEGFAFVVDLRKGSLVCALLRYEFIDLYPVELDRLEVQMDWVNSERPCLDVDYLMNMFMLHREMFSVWRPVIEVARSISLYAESRRGAVEVRSAVCDQTRILLEGYYPEALEILGGDLLASVAMAFLRRWPSLRKLKRAQAGTLRNFFGEYGIGSSTDIVGRLESIATYSVKKTEDPLMETFETILKQYLNQLSVLTRVIGYYDKKLTELLQGGEEESVLRGDFSDMDTLLLPEGVGEEDFPQICNAIFCSDVMPEVLAEW